MSKIGKKILIVDDEPDMREALRDKLNLDGFEVLEATNGEEGLEAALRDHPDLILLDIIMPKMGGMEMLEKLHADTWGKDAKVIVLTNLVDNNQVARIVKQESYDYLVKSDWKIEDVAAKIRERLGIA